MNKIDAAYLKISNSALEKAYNKLQTYTPDNIEYDIYRSAVIKEFEIILEQAGNLLKKILKPYFHTNKAVDRLLFKDIFRQAGIYGLITIDEVERWLQYIDNRNSTSHDYGESLANETLVLIEQFIADTKKIAEVVEANDN